MCPLGYCYPYGVNLASLLRGYIETAGEFALTTYGWGNHGIRTENYRYIRYNDGTEEFFDHRSYQTNGKTWCKKENQNKRWKT